MDEKSRSTAPRRCFVAVTSLLAISAGGCAANKPQAELRAKNEVIVMGMIHADHLVSSAYSIERIQEFVRRIDPDYILCEIPPDRLDRALTEFRQTGVVSEPRVRVFPEYVHAIFPLSKEMDFEIVPCAAWTQEMADRRREKLEEFKTTRKQDYDEMSRGMAWIEQRVKEENLDQDPLRMHTERYDEIVKQGMEPYSRLFNDDLGPGGWENINTAHFALIEAALDRHAFEGRRFLITFGTWHKYWFLERLRQRDDIMLRELHEFVEESVEP